MLEVHVHSPPLSFIVYRNNIPFSIICLNLSTLYTVEQENYIYKLFLNVPCGENLYLFLIQKHFFHEVTFNSCLGSLIRPTMLIIWQHLHIRRNEANIFISYHCFFFSNSMDLQCSTRVT